MDAQQDINLAFGWNRFNLRLIGAWPDPAVPDKGFAKYHFLIPTAFMISFICGPQSMNLPFIWGDIDLMAENLSAANIPVFNATMKLFFIWYHRNTLKPLVSVFMDDWYREKSEIERSIMLENAIIARKISIGCNLVTQAMVTAYLSLRIMAISQLDRKNATAYRCCLYPGYFPYDTRTSPCLELTCLAQIVSAYSATISYTAVDSFISMLVLHACGQYANLGEAVKTLFDVKPDVKGRKEFSEEFGAIINRHNHLNWFAKTIEDSFNALFLIQVLTCSVQLCFQGFQGFRLLLQDDTPSTLHLIFFVLFVSFVALHLYAYCYVGEKLLVQSSSLSHTAYCSKWFNATAFEARNLLLVMIRSTRPLYLTAGKFTPFCLETYSNILKTSMGYLSVLVAVAGND